jgi:transposase
MENRYRLDQIAKAQKKEKVIQAWLAGEKLTRLMKNAEIQLTRVQWWNLKRKYKESGFGGLIDGRRGGKPKKVTGEIKGYIKETKRFQPEVTSKELQEDIHHEFGQELNRIWIGKIAKRLGESLHRGRPQTGRRDYRKGVPIDRAGVYFLKGAESDMGGVEAIVEEIVKGRDKKIPEKSTLGRIRGTRPETIRKKVETLLYLPMFDMQKPYHLLKYHKRGLGIVTGSGHRYSYYTADIFLCDIEKLMIAKDVGEVLARCYLEALCIEIELEDGSYFYIDGHAKHVWSSKNIPKAFFTTLKRAERGLHQYFIHSSKGNPLILLTCPGDTRLPGVMFNLIDAFEDAVGKRIMKAAIFDREGLSLSIFEEFSRRKKYFITLLREGMYKGEESFKMLEEYKPLKTEEKDGELKILEWVQEAEYELKDKEKKRKLTVRVALVRKKVNEKEKIIPIITNLTRKEEPDIGRIAKRYFDRWPNQENMFRDAMEALKVDTNHGYKKKEVPNRVVERKKEELETNLRGISMRLNKAEKESKNAKKQLKDMERIYENQKKMMQSDRSELYAKIVLTKAPVERQKLLKSLRRVESEISRVSEQFGRQIAELKVSLKNKDRHEKGLRTQKKNKENELSSLDLERVLLEIKTEKDHLMSNFKTLLINLSSYAQRQYFPEEFHTFTMESMKRAFYQQDGYAKVRKKKIEVTLHSYDDPGLQKAVEFACEKFNNSDLRTSAGQRIKMCVEQENVKF